MRRCARRRPACSTWGQEDLQLLLVQKPDDKLDLLIYDPMPGGSGLLEQMLARWKELIATAKELAGRLRPRLRDGLLRLPQDLPQPVPSRAAESAQGPRTDGAT